ncbi:LOW QUALITY PROTEIN: antigen WC1.1-like [Chanos chanos]|uniref:LOW QUALITY PROTEIN: antigen WC1.1-like n=1 Tax=Chanos chanos TaxID=29144 RepID=A0A6J2X086_CHACN|nr:LOW QUALITY PROTEIN: antigen WC1.1-like [Chanos chanos]
MGGSRCSGRVEVYDGKSWSTVCDADFDLQDAAVACRELGCGVLVKVLGAAAFGKGEGQVWSEEIQCRGNESQIALCPTSSSQRRNCSHDNDVGLDIKKTRLSEGSHLCSGRVEIFNGRTWGTVCDADFDLLDAEVVCRELGCGVPVEVLGAAAFGKGEGQVWSEEIQCKGDESHIFFCPMSPSQSQNCSHDNDVGLICSAYTDFRLVNGSDSCCGRVELQYLSEWGTVCDASWDTRASNVLCRQLNCGSAVAVVGGDWFGEGSGQIWSDVFDCHGNETRLSACVISSWSRAACSHRQDAGVICSGSSMSVHYGRARLAGERECEGEVEVYLHEVWRRVLLDSWSVTEASVVCRQLGCGSVVKFYGSSPSSPGASDECLTGFQCSGTEAHLGNCSSPQTTTCSSSQQLSIICSGEYYPGHRSLRLVGSGSDCAGRLEVFHEGSWGTVCDDSWDIKDAQVVCRQLQCGEALSGPVPAWFGPGTGPIWLDEVDCMGNETSLRNCPSEGWGRHDCGHKEDVGVLCSEFKEIRLTEGCSGNLEVFYNGTWGNVCMNQMDSDTVSLICQELNCGKSGSVDWARSRVNSALNWIDGVKCRKHDISLWNCPSSPWGQNECSDLEVAQIDCSEDKSKTLRSHLSCSASPNHRTCSDQLPLRLEGGEDQCSGRLEVYHNGIWGSVCDDLWDIRDAQVVCRQLGCGPALRADGSAAFGRGEGAVWLSRVECTGKEIHLWDCSLSLKNHTDCSHKEDAGLTCTGMSGPVVSVAILYLSNASTCAPHLHSTPRVQTQPPANLPISTALFLVLGTLLLLLLVLLVVLFYQNRALRRALSKRRHMTLHEVVYEEIDHRLITERTTDSVQRGRLLSEGQNSGYEDVEDDLFSAESLTEEMVEYYDDVKTISGLKQEMVTLDSTENYDDVNSTGQSPDSVIDLISSEVLMEDYDDVITSGHVPDDLIDGVEKCDDMEIMDENQENQLAESLTEEKVEYYDDVNTTSSLTEEVVTLNSPENYDDVISMGQSPDSVTETVIEEPPEDYDDVITSQAVRCINRLRMSGGCGWSYECKTSRLRSIVGLTRCCYFQLTSPKSVARERDTSRGWLLAPLPVAVNQLLWDPPASAHQLIIKPLIGPIGCENGGADWGPEEQT